MSKTKLELTWIGKENRLRLEPRILIEDPAKSHHAAFRVSDQDLFDNRLIFGDKLEAQKALKSLEAERNRKRRDLFDAQDAIDAQRDELIKRIEGQLRQKHTVQTVFRFRWRLV